MIVTLGVRAVQTLFAAVVLALSAYLIGTYGPGHAPSLLGYGAFCGGAGLIIALVGLAAVFFDKLQGIIMLALDALATFFMLAGGLAFAIKIKVGSCHDNTFGDDNYLSKNYGTFGPSKNKDFGTNNPGKYAQRLIDDTQTRCGLVQADTAFVWFLFGTFVATLALSFMGRSGKRGGAIV